LLRNKNESYGGDKVRRTIQNGMKGVLMADAKLPPAPLSFQFFIKNHLSICHIPSAAENIIG
jgi:hypothetical protein